MVFEHREGAGGIGFASLMCAANYLWGLENDFPLFEEVQRQKAPLFEHPVKKKPFTTKDFDENIKVLMRETHALDGSLPAPEEQGLHSFRAGGALALKAAGAPPDVIKAMGRWRSDAWMIYIRDRRAESIQWGRRIRDVSELDVQQVPLADRHRPLEYWCGAETVDEVLQRSADTNEIRQRLDDAALVDIEANHANARDLESEFDETVQFLQGLGIDASGEGEPEEKEELFGLDAVAKLAKETAWPKPPAAASATAEKGFLFEMQPTPR